MSSATPQLRPDQRRRLRRLLSWGFSAVIGLEVVVIALAFTPASKAGFFICTTPCPVYDSALDALMGEVRDQIQNEINDELGEAQSTLSVIRTEQDLIRQRDVQHSRAHGNEWEPNLAPVTSTPSSRLQGVSFTADSPGELLAAIIPGAVPWDNYYVEHRTSADTALVTLRTSLDALYEHNQDIAQESDLTALAELADEVGEDGSDGLGYLAMDKLEIQSSLEVARQLHALRAQYAISSNIYAVAESHKTATEARSYAEDRESNCRVFGAAAAGPGGSIIAELFC